MAKWYTGGMTPRDIFLSLIGLLLLLVILRAFALI